MEECFPYVDLGPTEPLKQLARVEIECPFCGGVTVCCVSNLYSAGKRCDCGALLRNGYAYKAKD